MGKCPLLCRQKGRLTGLPSGGRTVRPTRPPDCVRPTRPPDCRMAILPDSRGKGRPTSRLVGQKEKGSLEASANEATPCHLLPQAATNGRNDTDLEKYRFLCRRKGRPTSLPSDRKAVRPTRLPDSRLSSLPDSRRTGRPTSRHNGRTADVTARRQARRQDCTPTGQKTSY